MLAGDLNARTGKANDFIDDENCNFIAGSNMPLPFTLPLGLNFDDNTNDHASFSCFYLCKCT